MSKKIPTHPARPTPPVKPKKIINGSISFPLNAPFVSYQKYSDEIEIEINLSDIKDKINKLALHQEETVDSVYGTLRIVVNMDRCGEDIDFFEVAELYYCGDKENTDYDREMEWYLERMKCYEEACEKYDIEEKEYSKKLQAYLEARSSQEEVMAKIKKYEDEIKKLKENLK